MRSSPALARHALLLALSAGACRDRARPRAPRDVEVTSALFRSDVLARGCPARTPPSHRGTVHVGELRGVERWRAEDSPHDLPYGIELREGASLRIDPCALVRVGASRAVRVERGARLDVAGDASRPVVFARLEREAWVGVEFARGAAPGSRLVEVELIGAGADAPERIPAALAVESAHLLAQRVTLRGAVARGVWLRRGGSFAESSTLRVVGCVGGVAAVDDADAATAVPLDESRDNGPNDLLVLGRSARVTRDARWGGRIDRYTVRAGVRVRVEGDATPTLTLLRGTTVTFGADASLEVGVDAPGAVRIEGETSAPVTLRGEGDARATWLGVTLGAQIDLRRSVLRNARVISAGAPSGGAVAGCGCGDELRGDAAVITVLTGGAPSVVENVLLHKGFERGVGVRHAVLGEALVGGGRVAAAPDAVACAEMFARGSTACAPR